MAETSGKGSDRRPGKGYGEAFDRIFGKEHKATSSRSIIDHRTKRTIEIVEFGERRPKGYIQEDIQPFVSPVTGEVISSRSTLREHNKRHGVTDSRDYSPEFMQKKQKERHERLTCQTPQDKQHRIESLIHAVDSQPKRRR